MKKVLVAVALVMGLGTSVAFAGNRMIAVSEVVAMVDDFTPIEVKDLPEAVQKVLEKDYAGQTVKEAAVEIKEDGTKTYKVVLAGEEDTENTVLFNENGEVQK